MAERRRGISARSRILIWIMVPVTVAVALLVGITGRVLWARIDVAARAELAHEAEKFRDFASGLDPDTGQRFEDVRHLLAGFVSRNLAEDEESFFSIVDGRPDRRSIGEPPARLDLDEEFVARAAEATVPVQGGVSIDGIRARYAVLPVTAEGEGQLGSLVVVEFLNPAEQEVWAIVRTLAAVGLVAVVVAGLTGWLVAGRVLAPIRTVRRTAEQIRESDLTRRIAVTGNDDVAELARTFNRMLDRIEGAFAAQNRFLEDAGHELRTPITIVRGHLEVMGEDPAERAQTIDLVVSELARMGRIIDELMMLARAERPDFLHLRPVDLTELGAEALAKMRAMAPRHWAIDEVADRTIRADGQRLTQALMQLASNAVGHTAESDRISVGTAVANGRVRIWVSDTGAGIDPDIEERLFERFVRGRSDGERIGAGLGLEIVATIAAAHGGRVDVDSEPGRGSTFTLDIPLVPTSDGGGGDSDP